MSPVLAGLVRGDKEASPDTARKDSDRLVKSEDLESERTRDRSSPSDGERGSDSDGSVSRGSAGSEEWSQEKVDKVYEDLRRRAGKAAADSKNQDTATQDIPNEGNQDSGSRDAGSRESSSEESQSARAQEREVKDAGKDQERVTYQSSQQVGKNVAGQQQQQQHTTGGRGGRDREQLIPSGVMQRSAGDGSVEAEQEASGGQSSGGRSSVGARGESAGDDTSASSRKGPAEGEGVAGTRRESSGEQGSKECEKPGGCQVPPIFPPEENEPEYGVQLLSLCVWMVPDKCCILSCRYICQGNRPSLQHTP